MSSPAGAGFNLRKIWQEGYAAFTCSQGDIDDLIEYIKRQEEHHRKTTFEEESRYML